MKIKIKTEDIIKDTKGYLEDFPKYTTQLMNLANQNAQGAGSSRALSNSDRCWYSTDLFFLKSLSS